MSIDSESREGATRCGATTRSESGTPMRCRLPHRHQYEGSPDYSAEHFFAVGFASPPSPAAAPLLKPYDKFAAKHLDAEDYAKFLEAELRTLQGELEEMRGLLNELGGYAVALRDPVALAYDGATTRAVIVNRLQAYHDARAALSSKTETEP